MKTTQFRHGKKLIQAWIPEEVLSKACNISMKGFTETIVEALEVYTEKHKSELEKLENQYESLILDATIIKSKINEFKEKELKESKKEIDKDISHKNKEIEKQLTEEDLQKRWKFTIWPIIKKKISEQGLDNVISDERMLNNFSKGLCISTGELKEKISTELGVV